MKSQWRLEVATAKGLSDLKRVAVVMARSYPIRMCPGRAFDFPGSRQRLEGDFRIISTVDARSGETLYEIATCARIPIWKR